MLIDNRRISIVLIAVLTFLMLASLTGCWDGLVWIRVVDGSTVDVADGATGDHSHDVLVDTAEDSSRDILDAANESVDIAIADAIDVISPTDSSDGGMDAVVADIVDSGADTFEATAEVASIDVADTSDVPPPPPDVPSVDTPPDITPDVPCPSGQTRCGSACVSTATDPINCGRCGGVCAGGVICAGGVCIDGISLAPLGWGKLVVEDRPAWVDTRTATVGHIFAEMFVTVMAQGVSAVYMIHRGWVRFDMSGVPAGVSAVSLRIGRPRNTPLDTSGFYLSVFRPSGASVVGSDFYLPHWGTNIGNESGPVLASADEFVSISIDPGAVETLRLGGGYIGIRSFYDQNDVTPPRSSSALGWRLGDPPPGMGPSFRLLVSYRP